MFKAITMEERLQKAETANRALRSQLYQSAAQTTYVAMMSGVDLPVTSDAAQQTPMTEGSDTNE